VGVSVPKEPDGLWNSKGNPRNRHGEWALEGKARAKHSHPIAQNKQATNEPRKQTKTQNHKRVNKQKPANPSPKEIIAN